MHILLASRPRRRASTRVDARQIDARRLNGPLGLAHAVWARSISGASCLLIYIAAASNARLLDSAAC